MFSFMCLEPTAGREPRPCRVCSPKQPSPQTPRWEDGIACLRVRPGLQRRRGAAPRGCGVAEVKGRHPSRGEVHHRGDVESCYDRATREHFEKRNAGKDAKLEGSFAAGGSSSAPKAKLGDAAANKLLADAGKAAIRAAAEGMKTQMYPPAESHYMVINWRGRPHSTPTSM